MPPNSAAIVDPFASGSLRTRGLVERGFGPIAVHSTPTVPDVFRSSWRPRDLVAVVDHEGDAARTADRLRTPGVCVLAAGCELGVELAAPERFGCYDSMTLLPGDGERQRALFAFAKGVLDALGVRTGPAHCELMWVDDPPTLVEVGARRSAGNSCTLNRLCSGTCQLDLTIDAYTDPARFLARDDASYVLERTAANVFLVPPMPGILRGAPRRDREARILPRDAGRDRAGCAGTARGPRGDADPLRPRRRRARRGAHQTSRAQRPLRHRARSVSRGRRAVDGRGQGRWSAAGR